MSHVLHSQNLQLNAQPEPLLQISNLSVRFGNFRAVDQLSLSLSPGQTLGIVGESGSGKSVSMLALMGLIDAPGLVQAERMQFMQQDLLHMDASAKRKIIGKDIAMIFQDPMTSLNPSYTVEYQIAEVLKLHLGLRGDALRQRCIELLELVEIPAPASRLTAYPHELSGGMSQRVMIAMAIACEPQLLIADEPTTALDVTIQAQIMHLLERLQKERHMALIMITHDLAVVAEVADHIAVMYAGQLVETGRIPAIFKSPAHPYTEALLASLPEFHLGSEAKLKALPGIVPGQYDRPSGCLLSPRCPYVQDSCHSEVIALQQTTGGEVRCLFPRNTAVGGSA